MAFLTPAKADTIGEIDINELTHGTEINDIQLVAGLDVYVMCVKNELGARPLGTLIFIPGVAPHEAVVGL